MKEKTKIIISVIITFVITLTLTVTASLVTSATNITYTSDKTNKTNVNDSLNELYDIANSSSGSEEITNGFTKSEAFSIGRYTMSGNSSRVHSRSGVSPFANTNIETTRTYATALGNTFQLLDYHYFIYYNYYI